MRSSKVVGVGFQKTGTSSLGLALHHLGYRVASYEQFRDLNGTPADGMGQAIADRAKSILDDYDAFKDTPWPVLYRELDGWLPGAKFILITRDPDRWIRSVVKDFGRFPNQIHEYIYGVSAPAGHEAAFLDRYEQHNRDVVDYFRDRPGDFLHLHLDKGEVGWEPICHFLGHDVPDLPWPHANTVQAKRQLKRRQRFWNRVRKLEALSPWRQKS